jgi:hypothetical protein
LEGATHAVGPYTVEVLHTTEDRAYVRGSLPRAALVVASGVHHVVPGQQVRLAEDAVVALSEGGHHGNL